MNQDQPVTRREFEVGLDNVQAELTTAIRGSEANVRHDLLTAMRDIETNLLTAFHGYARGNATRLSAMDVTDRELRLRMDELENRMLNLETRRPPAA